MTNPKTVAGFDRCLAILVAIDNYANIRGLHTPVSDAKKLAEVLRDSHGFQTKLLLNEEATCERLRGFLTEEMPERVGSNDRVLFYFAGHGISLKSVDGQPKGYILPQDAGRDGTGQFYPMVDLHDALSALPCRHMLVMLDCCFAGTLRWSSTRDLVLAPESLHQERYAWFVRDKAWQAIASAAHDQKALDVAAEHALGMRGGSNHSPFAQALITGLAGAADKLRADGTGDGVITATELYLHLEEQLRPPAGSDRLPQMPVLWPLKNHDKGQFVFLVPGQDLDLPPAPPLDEKANPWRGLKVYESTDADLFFGRRIASEQLRDRLLGKSATQTQSAVPAQRFIVVTGPSGIGKSSLVRAGLIPRLPVDMPKIVVRPGSAPFASLAAALRALSQATCAPPEEGVLKADPTALATWIAKQNDKHILLVVDQAEELLTMSSIRPHEVGVPKDRLASRTAKALRFFSEGEESARTWLRSAVGLVLPALAGRAATTSGVEANESNLHSYNKRMRSFASRLQSAFGLAVPQPSNGALVGASQGDLTSSYLQQIADALEQCPNLSVVLTVRSEFEPQFTKLPLGALWSNARYLVPQMTQDELRRVIEGPATIKVIRFESDELVDKLVNEVVQMPGALPLLSFALSEMYRHYIHRGGDNRALTNADHDALQGGVVGSMRVRANQLIVKLDEAHQATARRVLERLVSVETGEYARRRVARSELQAAEPDENDRILEVVRLFDEAFLVVTDEIDNEPYIELAHDALILGWDKLLTWVRGDAMLIADLRRLTPDAEEWVGSSQRKIGLLWSDPARLATIKQLQAQPAPGLNNIESNFAHASIRRANRNLFIRWSTIAAMGALAVAIILGYRELNSTQAYGQLQKKFAQSNELVAQARAAINGQSPMEAFRIVSTGLQLHDDAPELGDRPDLALLLARVANGNVPNDVVRLQSIDDFSIHPNGERIAIAGRAEGKNRVIVAATANSADRKIIEGDWRYTAIAFSPKGDRLACAVIIKVGEEYHSAVRIFDSSLALERTITFPGVIITNPDFPDEKRTFRPKVIKKIRFTPNSERLVLAGAATAAALEYHWRGWFDFASEKLIEKVDTVNELAHFSNYAPIMELIGNNYLLSDGYSEVYLDNLSSGERTVLGHHARLQAIGVSDIAVSPSGSRIAVVGGENAVTIFDRAGDKWVSKQHELPGPARTELVAWLSEDELAMSRSDFSVTSMLSKDDEYFRQHSHRWNGETFKSRDQFRSWLGHSERITALVASQNGEWFATASEDRTVRVVYLRQFDQQVLTGNTRGLRKLWIRSEDDALFAVGLDNVLRRWRLKTLGRASMPADPKHRPPEYRASDSEWDDGGGLSRMLRREARGFVRFMDFSPDGRHVATTTYGGVSSIWTTDGKLVSSVYPNKNAGLGGGKIAFSSDSNWLATQQGGQIDLVRLSDGRTFSIAKGGLWPIDLHSTGKWAEVDDTGRIRLHPIANGINEKITPGRFGQGDRFFVGLDGDVVKVWDLTQSNATARTVKLPRKADPGTMRLSSKADFATLLPNPADEVYLVNLSDLSLKVLKGDNVVGFPSISANGEWVAAAGRYGEIYLWPSSGGNPRVFERHSRYVTAVDISPDGRWLLSGSRDRSVRLWSTQTRDYIDFSFLNPIEQVRLDSDSSRIWVATGTGIQSRFAPTGTVKSLRLEADQVVQLDN